MDFDAPVAAYIVEEIVFLKSCGLGKGEIDSIAVHMFTTPPVDS